MTADSRRTRCSFLSDRLAFWSLWSCRSPERSQISWPTDWAAPATWCQTAECHCTPSPTVVGSSWFWEWPVSWLSFDKWMQKKQHRNSHDIHGLSRWKLIKLPVLSCRVGRMGEQGDSDENHDLGHFDERTSDILNQFGDHNECFRESRLFAELLLWVFTATIVNKKIQMEAAFSNGRFWFFFFWILEFRFHKPAVDHYP